MKCQLLKKLVWLLISSAHGPAVTNVLLILLDPNTGCEIRKSARAFAAGVRWLYAICADTMCPSAFHARTGNVDSQSHAPAKGTRAVLFTPVKNTKNARLKGFILIG